MYKYEQFGLLGLTAIIYLGEPGFFLLPPPLPYLLPPNFPVCHIPLVHPSLIKSPPSSVLLMCGISLIHPFPDLYSILPSLPPLPSFAALAAATAADKCPYLSSQSPQHWLVPFLILLPVPLLPGITMFQSISRSKQPYFILIWPKDSKHISIQPQNTKKELFPTPENLGRKHQHIDNASLLIYFHFINFLKHSNIFSLY